MYFQYIGISLVQVGLIFGFYQATKIIFDIPTGLFADRYGKRMTTLISVVCTIISLVIAVLVQNFAGMVVAIIIYGLGYVMNNAALSALIIESVIDDGKKAIAKINAKVTISFYTSFALASLVAGFVSHNYSYEMVYIITIIMQVFAVVSILLIPSHRDKKTVEISAEKLPKTHLKEVVKYINNNKKFRFLLLIGAIFSIGYIPADNYYMNVLADAGVNMDLAGIIIAFQMVFSAVLAMFVLKWIKHRFDNIILVVVPILSIILLIIFTVVPNIYVGAVFFGLQIVLMCINGPIASQHLHQDFEPRFRATALSLRTFLMAAIALVVQPAFGCLAIILNLRLALLPLFVISLLCMIANVWVGGVRMPDTSTCNVEKI
jgi:MFS family permease